MTVRCCSIIAAILPKRRCTDTAPERFGIGMNGHVILVGSLGTEHFPTHRAQECGRLFDWRLADHVRRYHSIMADVFAFVHQTNVRIETLQASTSFRTPTAAHRLHVFFVYDCVLLSHVHHKFIVRFQVDVAFITVNIEAIRCFSGARIVNF